MGYELSHKNMCIFQYPKMKNYSTFNKNRYHKDFLVTEIKYVASLIEHLDHLQWCSQKNSLLPKPCPTKPSGSGITSVGLGVRGICADSDYHSWKKGFRSHPVQPPDHLGSPGLWAHLLIDSSVFSLAASRGRILILPRKLFRPQQSSILCPMHPPFFKLNTSTFLIILTT